MVLPPANTFLQRLKGGSAASISHKERQVRTLRDREVDVQFSGH
jgi:hypothetical protein